MDTLLDALKQESEVARADALPLYRELLERNASPEPGDGEALKEVIRTLGISIDDVAADLQAIARDSEMRALLLTDQVYARLVAERDRAALEFTGWLRDRLAEAAQAFPGPGIVLVRAIEELIRVQLGTTASGAWAERWAELRPEREHLQLAALNADGTLLGAIRHDAERRRKLAELARANGRVLDTPAGAAALPELLPPPDGAGPLVWAAKTQAAPTMAA